MSYGPPPKTAYGDQDFIKEDLDAQTPQSGFGQPPNNYQTTKNPYIQPNPYGGVPISQQPQSVMNYSTFQGQQPAMQDPQSMPTMTHEDILFMQGWRRDVFFYKVIPISVIANAAVFYYSRSKQWTVKRSSVAYLAATMGSYVIGIATSKSDLWTRVRESNLNTPFMSKMKSMMNANTYGMANEFHDGSSYQSAKWATTRDEFSRPPNSHPQSDGLYSDSSYSPNPFDSQQGYNQSNQNQMNDHHGLQDNNNQEPKRTTSYEELRAKNRGLNPPRNI